MNFETNRIQRKEKRLQKIFLSEYAHFFLLAPKIIVLLRKNRDISKQSIFVCQILKLQNFCKKV